MVHSIEYFNEQKIIHKYFALTVVFFSIFQSEILSKKNLCVRGAVVFIESFTKK